MTPAPPRREIVRTPRPCAVCGKVLIAGEIARVRPAGGLECPSHPTTSAPTPLLVTYTGASWDDAPALGARWSAEGVDYTVVDVVGKDRLPGRPPHAAIRGHWAFTVTLVPV